MRDIIIMGFVFAMLPVCFFRPYVGALMWVWISLMNPHRLTWGPANGFPFAMLVAVTTMAGVLISSDRGKFPAARETTLLILMSLFFTLTTTFALMPTGAWMKWDRVTKIIIMTIVPLFLLQQRNRLRLLLLTMAGSIGFFSVKGGIFSLVTGGSARVFGPPRSFIADNNALALAELMMLPFMVYLARTEERRPWVRRLLYASAVLTLVSIIFSYSRGALVGLAAVIAATIVSARRWKLAAAFLVIAAIGIPFIPHQWYERMGTIGTYQSDRSANMRLQSWRFALDVAADRPLTGGGFRVFSTEQFTRYGHEAIEAYEAHSIYFETLGEHGYPGLILFLALLSSCFWSLRGIDRRIRGRPSLAWAKDYSVMLRLSLVAYAAGGAFLSLAYFDLYYDIVASVVLLKIVVRKELAQEAREAKSAAAASPTPPRLARVAGRA